MLSIPIPHYSLFALVIFFCVFRVFRGPIAGVIVLCSIFRVIRVFRGQPVDGFK